MYDYMKTILSSIKVWVDKQFKQSVSDWNQNDKSALNYIKNKPFGENADGTIKKMSKEYIEGLAGENVTNKTFNINGEDIVADSNAEIFNNYESNIATGAYAHAEGSYTKAIGMQSHAEGVSTTASGYSSHAEGDTTIASDRNSHAEGFITKATGQNSHAEGNGTEASGNQSHAEGQDTKAEGDQSHAEGYSTTANGENQHVQGRFNITDETSAHIVGNGNFDERSNAHTIDWSGNAWFSGDVYVGSTSGVNKDEGSKKLVTEEYVNTEMNKKSQVQFIIWEAND